MPRSYEVGEATRQYQVALEHERAIAFTASLEELEEASAASTEARRLLEVAWLEHHHAA